MAAKRCGSTKLREGVEAFLPEHPALPSSATPVCSSPHGLTWGSIEMGLAIMHLCVGFFSLNAGSALHNRSINLC